MTIEKRQYLLGVLPLPFLSEEVVTTHPIRHVTVKGIAGTLMRENPDKVRFASKARPTNLHTYSRKRINEMDIRGEWKWGIIQPVYRWKPSPKGR